jgi:succinate-semialdehyde dehydrogenase/glutarate-semialdehyde dehydrogenase
MPIESLNPATGELQATFAPCTREEIEFALHHAALAQKPWAALSMDTRAVPMRRVAHLLRTRAQEYAALMAEEMGKPVSEGEAEIHKCAQSCDFFADNAGRLLAPRLEPTEAAQTRVQFDPLGVILAVMPWNFPFWQVFRFIAPQLMAGNAGILKHASNVPRCALAIESLLREAEFPEHLFRTLLATAAQVEPLIADSRVAGVTLTGSEQAGVSVATAAGRALKPVVLELGGSDPFIVLKDADITRAASAGAAARTMNAGQSCISPKRFIVEDEVHDAFLEALVNEMRKIHPADPMDPQTRMGPLARRSFCDNLQAQVDAALQAGARLHLGGKPQAGPGAFYPPTVLSGIQKHNPLYSEEVFGPVACVFRALDEADAIRIANDTRFGLGASGWTQDPAAAERLVAALEAGTVSVNAPVKSDARLPFGGVKASGIGRELGQEGIRAFMNIKTVWIHSP